MQEATPQIESDRRLLQFLTYEDYLDSLVTVRDHCYLQNKTITRTIAELGYRSSGETLSREQFDRRRAAVVLYLYPPYKPYELASEGLKGGDPIHIELSIRERPNRVGILSVEYMYQPVMIYIKVPFQTIIFLRDYTKKGFEISGYIDYAARLKTMDWKPFFKGIKKIIPNQNDLGYFHWRAGVAVSNDSPNYKVLIDPDLGLIFQNRFDRRKVCVDPAIDPGSNSTRKRIDSFIYDHVIIYDHIVRQRI